MHEAVGNEAAPLVMTKVDNIPVYRHYISLKML